jgi:NAD-dependent dihydropyrimidine dehydrogenase PreA subunit/flavodoxin
MKLDIRKALVVYCSPSGSTERVAQAIQRKVKALEIPVTLLDLGCEPDLPFILPQLLDAKDNLFLYVGSPVYASRPLPQVMAFISMLPQAKIGYSVPFVTWGGVTSGIALHDMGKALAEKGYHPLGAAKVLAAHSLMWASDNPVGKGHPNADDDALIEALVETVHGRVRAGNPIPLPLSALAYQPDHVHATMEKDGIHAARSHFPTREVDLKRCTRCGVCVERCPAQALSLSPDPQFGESCICCCRCVRLCPEAAIRVDLSPVVVRIRERARQSSEQPFTKIFV